MLQVFFFFKWCFFWSAFFFSWIPHDTEFYSWNDSCPDSRLFMHAFWFLIGSDSVKQHNKKLPWQLHNLSEMQDLFLWGLARSLATEAKFATRASLWPHTETIQGALWLKELWLFVGLCLRPISRADLWLSLHSSQLSWSSETASKRLCQLWKLEKLWHFESKNSNRCLKNLQKYRNLVEAKHHWRFFQALFPVWTNPGAPRQESL